MYAYIRGEITEIGEAIVIIETSGIGYELNVSQNTLRNKNKGDICRLYTYLSVREDGISLFGFADKAEKELFLRLISVSGVGPKLAMTILSGASTNELISAIAAGNAALLYGVKGVGKKTAERIIIELKDKMGEIGTMPVITAKVALNEIQEEAVSVLVALGFKRDAAEKTVSLVYSEGMTVNQTVHKAIGG